MVFLIASCPAEQLTELVHLERKILVRISTMKVSCKSVLKELVGAMTVKCHVAYSLLSDARGNDTQEGPVFSSAPHFCEGHCSKSSAHRGWSPLKRHTKWSCSIKRHACNTPAYLHKKPMHYLKLALLH